jgi:protein AroM
VGLLTIGQSPRSDVTNDLAKMLPQDIEIFEAGALDDLSLEEIIGKLAPKQGETLYVTRLRSGLEVKISKERIIDLMQKKIELLDSRGVDIIGILCSGEFPEFRARVPILYPDKILKGMVSGIKYSGESAVLVPAGEQIGYGRDKWAPYLGDPIVIHISPYTSKPEDFIEVGRELSKRDVRLVIMDCIGYTLEQKKILKQIVPLARVITSRGALARAIAELI